MKRALITGITGQDGAYISKLLLDNGYEVYGTLREQSLKKLSGLEYLEIKNRIRLISIDLTDHQKVQSLIKNISPDEIYNLAAQSSVARSFADPGDTMSFNIQSVINLLEAIRTIDPKIRFYQASSSEMFGKASSLPVTEDSRLNPLSPYAASKATAHMLVNDYRKTYDIFAVAGILFNHESYLRAPGFFVKKVIQDSILIHQGKKDVLSVGNIEVRRDFGYGPKYVEAMWKMLQTDKPEDYMICSGRSILLKDIILYVFHYFHIPPSKLIVDPRFYRPNDIDDIYGDNTKAKRQLHWEYEHSFYDVLDLLIKEELAHNNQ